MNINSKNPTQQQLNRLVPFTPSEKKWFDHYLGKASAQNNPQFTKNFQQGKVKPMIVSEVEASIDQATSENQVEEKGYKSSAPRSKPVKRKPATGGKGAKKKKKSKPNDIFG